MIHTVTMNPSLDYIVDVKNFTLGETNRSGGELMLPGGKGINVSIVLRHLGIESRMLGFAAGFTGREMESRLKEMQLQPDLVWLEKGQTRINVKLRSGLETEINGMGPVMEPENLTLFLKKCEEIRQGDYLVLAGNVPQGISDGFYCDLMEHLQEKKLQIVVDASGPLFKKTLSRHPFLVKPNRQELSEILECPMETEDEICAGAKELQQRGACNVLVSLGGEGAVLLGSDGQLYRCGAPRGVLKNSVGAGDSMVAGFLAEYSRSQNLGESLRMGIAAGSASAFSEQLATLAEVQKLLAQIPDSSMRVK